ncbi:retrovirus-related pol polyprotein from transposon TNT 1-94, partial [Tanacetum coccineum]
MILIDASSRWSHVCLLASRNVAFARLLAQIIQLRAHFPDYQIKKIRLDNAGEFASQSFNDFCMSIGITVEHHVAHVHTQNDLAESLIKLSQLIARPLLMKSKLWGHAILHAAALIRLRPSASHKCSPLQLVSEREPTLNAPSRIDIPETPDESNVRRMHGRPMGSKDTNPQKKKEHNTTGKVQEVVINKIPNEINNNTEYVDKSLEDDHIPSEYEISINFVQNGTTWNRNETRVDEIFALFTGRFGSATSHQLEASSSSHVYHPKPLIVCLFPHLADPPVRSF